MIEKIRQILKDKNVDAFFITNINDIRYLSGFTGSTAYMIITNEKSFFYTDGRYTLQAAMEVGNGILSIVVKSYREMIEKEMSKYNKVLLQPNCFLSVAEIVRKTGAEIIVDDEDSIKVMRMIKNENEINLIKAQYKLAAKSFKDSLSSFRIGVSEKEWAAILEYNLKKNNADGVSFETIVASGKRSALPHGVASNKIIDENEPVLIDFGSKQGYTSDYTRMVYNGSDKEVKNIIGIVREALLKAIAAVEVGVECREIDLIAREHISSFGYGKYFNHSLGHGVGIDVHELPLINVESKTKLAEGMIFTIEPGIYLPNSFGVRLEDTVLVTSSGAEVISNHLDNYVYSIEN